MTLQTQTYYDINFTLLDDLCADVTLGQTFMEKDSAIMLSFIDDQINFIAENDLKNTWAYLDNLSTADNTSE